MVGRGSFPFASDGPQVPPDDLLAPLREQASLGVEYIRPSSSQVVSSTELIAYTGRDVFAQDNPATVSEFTKQGLRLTGRIESAGPEFTLRCSTATSIQRFLSQSRLWTIPCIDSCTRGTAGARAAYPLHKPARCSARSARKNSGRLRPQRCHLSRTACSVFLPITVVIQCSTSHRRNDYLPSSVGTQFGAQHSSRKQAITTSPTRQQVASFVSGVTEHTQLRNRRSRR